MECGEVIAIINNGTCLECFVSTAHNLTDQLGSVSQFCRSFWFQTSYCLPSHWNFLVATRSPESSRLVFVASKSSPVLYLCGTEQGVNGRFWHNFEPG